jgi:hypothetical protein
MKLHRVSELLRKVVFPVPFLWAWSQLQGNGLHFVSPTTVTDSYHEASSMPACAWYRV